MIRNVLTFLAGALLLQMGIYEIFTPGQILSNPEIGLRVGVVTVYGGLRLMDGVA